MRQTRNTPAVTMVAAWISADTGVGPSIASGNHVCRKSWADLPIAPTKSRKAQSSTAFQAPQRKSRLVSDKAGAAEKTSSSCSEPVM